MSVSKNLSIKRIPKMKARKNIMARATILINVDGLQIASLIMPI